MKTNPIVLTIDHSSFRIIYDLYYEPVCRFLNFYTRDSSAIEDVVQDIFVKLWEDKEFLEVSHVKAYLYNAARNKMLNHLRNEETKNIHLRQWQEDTVESFKSIECYNINEFSVLLRKAVDTLPERCRHIFIQHKWAKMNYKQIAEQNQISIKTVEVQMSIALKRIRKYVAAYYSLSCVGLYCILTI